MSFLELPAVDLKASYDSQGAGFDACAKALFESFEKYGFLCVTGYRIPVDLIARTKAAMREFFLSSPDVKNTANAHSY